MSSLDYTTLESNKRFKLNFDGGDLSSDAGLLLIKEFISKLHFDRLIGSIFHTNDFSNRRTHKDDTNLLQVIYQIFSAYYEDDCADELTNDPILTAVLAKKSLASQPTLSRFYNRMDDNTLRQFDTLMKAMRRIVYKIKRQLQSLLCNPSEDERHTDFSR